MSTLISNYPIFEKNQVLTEAQLNQLVKYLDQQNRLTRVRLIGLGIVCGLDVLCEANTLTITKGVGVTSEGFLIQMGECVNTQYREYVKPGTDSYPPFEDPITHEQDIQLSELLTPDIEIDPEETLDNLTSEILQGKVVLLYLECYDKDLKSCIGKSCDELGIDRIFTLRRLLISKEDLEKVHERTNGGMPDTLFPDKFKLPPMVIPKPLFNYDGPESGSYYFMGLEYLGTLKDYAFRLFEQLVNTYDVYQPILEDIYPDGNPFTSATLSESLEKIQQYFDDFLFFEEPVYGVQYFYDFFKDLTVAYNEFKEESYDLAVFCCLDMSRFPRHLLLGEACDTLGECERSQYRHYFVESHVIGQQQDKLELVKFLHKRLVLLIESFSVERLMEVDQIELKITPSIEKMGFLSQRTIPFYYDSTRQSSFAYLNTLENTWNYEIYRKCIPSEFPLQMSYDNHNIDQLRENPVNTPLKYDLDQFNFFRIEGILGKPVSTVKKELLGYRQKKNLPFDVKTVYFGDLVEEGYRARCAYADLQPSYGIWRNKALLFINNLVKTNKNVEKVVLNRNELYKSGLNNMSGFSFGTSTFLSDSSREKKAETKTSEEKAAFNIRNLSNMMSMRDPVSFEMAAMDLSNLNLTLGNVLANADASRSASFESSRDTSIRGIFTGLNTCLHNMIQAMPNDFRDFDMKEWLGYYKCVMRMYITVMKFLASETRNLIVMLIVYVILVVLCVLFRLLRFISIYPYITIRILYDTARERLEHLQSSLQFTEFLRHHPGMDHKAGVAPGQTLVLVYQLEHLLDDEGKGLGNSENGFNRFLKMSGHTKERGFFFKRDEEFPNLPGIDQVIEVTSEMTDNVVANFTLPFVCCDDCGDMPHTPVTLDPLATPICGVVQFIAGQKDDEEDALPWNYKPLNIRILNDVYDPAVYIVRLPEGVEPNFGTYTFERGIYDPDPNKEAQIFRYIVDEDLLAAEMEVNDDFFIIDEFEYEIYDVNRSEVVDGDKISIFIPVVPSAESQTGNVTGLISMVDDNGNSEILPGVTVVLKDTNLRAISDANGTYQMGDIPVGEQTFIAAGIGLISQEKQKNIVEGENTLDFVMQRSYNYGIRYDRVYKAMGVEESSEDANNIRVYYSTQMSNYQKTVEDLEKEENSSEVTAISKAKASITLYSCEEDISVIKLNNDFNMRRNELIESWDGASGKEKEMYKEALESLTGAYVNRLAFLQPKRLSNTTKETLRETANIFNSRKELGMKATFDTWNNDAKGFLPDDFRENINATLKLR